MTPSRRSTIRLCQQVERLLEEYAPLLTDAQTADGAISL